MCARAEQILETTRLVRNWQGETSGIAARVGAAIMSIRRRRYVVFSSCGSGTSWSTYRGISHLES